VLSESSQRTATHHRPLDDFGGPGAISRFAPGTILAGRYRIVAPLGSGGAGQVYRAEDTKLGQTVAMKFVARRIAHERALFERIVSEVRIGREVAHPNLCRIYDMGEVDNQYFITMEYVDGENLASLLRRVGRLPEERALEVAREICAGLAAAHDRGVIHRDMKPSNVMIDGRGHARITDFGLAVATGGGNADSFAGTPAYMAPEQLQGAEATVRSDIYGLGLLMYELFSGQRLFGGTLPEISGEHTRPKRPPSSIVRGISPAVERVILHCIEERPGDRPESVRDVLAALPGTDPLHSAISAGETPSPAAVAAAERVGELSLPWAWAAMIALLVLLATIAVLSRWTTLYRQAPLAMSPDVLADRARQVIRAAGYEPRPAGSRRWFGNDLDVLKLAALQTPLPEREKALRRTSPLRFGYRESPFPLVPQGRGATVTASDPPMDAPDMVTVILDSNGRLMRFIRVPTPAAPAGSVNVDWLPFFTLAGLDPARFRPSPVPWLSPVDHDTRNAWRGTLAGEPLIVVDVHAAAMAGRPVLFEAAMQSRHSESAAARARQPTVTEEFTAVAGFATIFLGSLVLAAVVARRNLRLGRGDRAAARKIGLLVFGSLLAAGLLSADHTADAAGEWGLLVGAAGNALYHAGALWLFYIAAEPYVRRRQPELLISWSRVLRGYFRDPLVARDVLVGCVLGAVLHLFYGHLVVLVPAWLGMPAALPNHSFPEKLAGGVWPLVSLAALLGSVPRDSVLALLLFSSIRSLTRSSWLTAGVVTLLSAVPHMGRDVASRAEAPFVICAAAVFVFALCRIGLLSAMVTLFVGSWLEKSLFIFDPRSWLFVPSLFYLVVTLAVAGYGFRYALGARPMLGHIRLAE
jgi:hypothetical protein